MGILNNLPVILAALTAFLAGLYGYLNSMPNSQVYQNMCLFLIIFYVIGLFLRRTLKGILEDMEEKAKLQAAQAELLLSGGEADALGADGEGAEGGGAEGEEGAETEGGGAEDADGADGDGGDDGPDMDGGPDYNGESNSPDVYTDDEYTAEGENIDENNGYINENGFPASGDGYYDNNGTEFTETSYN